MKEQDTIRLLRECDAGVKMGVEAIDQVLESVRSEELKQFLIDCKNKHEILNNEVQEQLRLYEDEGKDPNPMAKGMSWIKTNVMLAVDESDARVADLITDGCHMGVKSLNRYLNQHTDASEKSKELTKRLIDREEKLTIDIRRFL